MEEGLNENFLTFPSEYDSNLMQPPPSPLRQLETGISQGPAEAHLTFPSVSFLPKQCVPHLQDYQVFPSSHPPYPLLHSETGSIQGVSELFQTFPPLSFNNFDTGPDNDQFQHCQTFPPLTFNNLDTDTGNDQFLEFPSTPSAVDSATVSIINQDNALGDCAGLLPPNLPELSEVPFAKYPELSPVMLQPTPPKECDATPGFPSSISPDFLSYEESYDIPFSPDYLNWNVTDMDVEKMEAVLQEEPELDKSQYSKRIYNNAPITLHESLVSILTVVLKYSLSGQLIESMLRLIDLHLPKEENIFQTSLYLFKKYFSQIRGHTSYAYYCSKCLEKCEKSDGCLSCGKKAPLCCLISLSLVDQLRALMARKGFFSQLVPLQSRFNKSGYADVYDGELYKDYIKEKYVGDLPDLTCEWYTDGAEMFKSANISVWNLFFSINELPYSERYKKKNLLIPALWVGPVKPPTNLFLQAVVPELRELALGVGMEVADLGRTVDISLKVTGGTGDTPARALILNMVAHNGEYACQVCLQKGKCRDDGGSVRVFPYDEDQMNARTVENFKSHGEWALMLKKLDPTKAYMGLHGTTPLSQISLDPVRGTGIDVMHNLWGGCGKLNINFFVDSSSKYSSLPCHLSKLERECVDERLLQIKPPHYLTRIPKSIQDVGSWQTSIHKSMCLYYSLPVLEGIVNEEYFVHYSTLVAAAQIINSDIVTNEDIDEADALIKKYVSCFPSLYGGDRYMTINLHLLLHLSTLVRQKGPAWVTACFPLESVNGEILKLIHGPKYPEMQIASSLQMSLCLEDLVYNLPPGEPKEFCSALLSTTNRRQEIKLGENIIQGKWQQLQKQPPEYLNQLISTHPSLNGFNITTFNQLRRRKILYAVESFRQNQARDSSAVLYNVNNHTKTGIIQDFLRVSKCYCKTCLCDCELFAVIQELKVVAVFPTMVPGVCVPNTHQYERLESTILLPVHDLLSVSVKMQIGSKLFISKRSNNQEIE